VLDDRGQPIDDVLDASSDRRLDPGAHTSLGPLPSGRYTIALVGPRGARRATVTVVDADVTVTIR
jgi:hypothetical protein